MNIPKTIKIGGHIFEIVLKEKLSNPKNRGEVNFDNHFLLINNKMCGQETEFVFWHEILHIIDKIYNSQKLKEEIICRLSEGLYQVLKDNFKSLDNLKERI